MKKLTLSWTAVLVLMGCATSPSYKGNWKSLGAEPQGNGTYATRDFKLTDNQWEISYTLYLDEGMKNPVFKFRGVGPYSTGKESPAVKGARETTFNFSRKYFTLLTDDENVAKQFGLAGAKKGEEMDITDNGFSFFPSVKVYDKEYDLLKRDGDELYLGERPKDGSGMNTEDKRPTSLGAPLKKY